MKIYSKNESYTGVSASVNFVNGEGETGNAHLIGWFRDHGYTVEDAPKYDLSGYDCIVDAIDTVSAKIELIARAAQASVPIVSAMGCGNRLDATKFVVTDLYKTQNDPLARVLRHELRRRGVRRLRVVCSTAPVLTPRPGGETKGTAGRPAPGSVSWVPGVAGMILAGEAVKLIAGITEE